MNIYSNSNPTWLMIKKHKITGLLYFCKTAKYDPEKYVGSGMYWKNHLKHHGKHIETIWCERFDDRDLLIDFATLFSELFDIVNAINNDGKKIWANLEIENGIDGMPLGTDRGFDFKRKAKINNSGSKNPSYGTYWWNNGSEEIKSKICPAGWTRGRSPVLKQVVSNTIKLNNNRSGKNNSSYGKKWWTNGIDSVKSDNCPEGWYRGVGIKFKEKCRKNVLPVCVIVP